MMRNDFAVFILTHGRPDNIKTLQALKNGNYTGKIYIIIDNEDKTAEQYYNLYGDKVVMFDKKKMAEKCDTADNFGNRKVILFARNVCFGIAKEKGLQYFLELDDDYINFRYRYEKDGKLMTTDDCKDLDGLFTHMIDFLDTTNAATVALAQGGDFVGGLNGGNFKKRCLRKAMNTFFCNVDKPFQWQGTINEDVNTYTLEGSRGKLFLSITSAMVSQKDTQQSKGGMTETYLENGTYLKSFYSVVFMPSAVKVAVMQTSHSRIHHSVNWNNCCPKILNEKWKKT